MSSQVNSFPTKSSKNNLKLFFLSSIAIFLVIIDQLTKKLVICYLQGLPDYTFKVNNFINIVCRWNYGISFGFLNQYMKYSNAAFAILNSLITSYLCYLLVRSKSLKDYFAYTLIIGGATGNLIDRFFKGAVFDFINLHYLNYHFPVFNLADSFITIGAIVALYYSYARR